MNRIGMKTAASDVVIVRIVKPISRDPLRDASSRPSPASMWRTMFSSITIASSTTKPTQRISAIIDRLLMLNPRICMTANVPRIEKGSASAGMSVADPLWRKRKITATTSSSVISIVHWMSVNAARMLFDRSPRTVMCTEGGSCDSRIGQQLADGVGDLDGVRAWLPLEREIDGALAALAGVEPRGVEVVLDAVDDGGDLIQPQRPAVAVGHDHPLELIGVVQLSRRLDVVGLLRAEQLARGRAHVPVLERLVDFVDADLLRQQLVGIHLNADGVFRLAPDLNLPDATHHRDARSDDRFRVIVENR